MGSLFYLLYPLPTLLVRQITLDLRIHLSMFNNIPHLTTLFPDLLHKTCLTQWSSTMPILSLCETTPSITVHINYLHILIFHSVRSAGFLSIRRLSFVSVFITWLSTNCLVIVYHLTYTVWLAWQASCQITSNNVVIFIS